MNNVQSLVVKQNDEQCSESRLAVNELHIERYSVTNTFNVILQWYHADMIYYAEIMLWDNYGAYLLTI